MSRPSTGPELDRRRLTAAAIDLTVPLAGVAATTLAGLSLTRGMLLVILGWTLYYFFALESGDGQTLGKRAMNLRVVSADGGAPTMEQIAKRTLVRVVDGPIVGLIAMLATGERRARVGDIVAGTVVTDAGSPAAVDADPERRDLEPDPDPTPEPAFAAPAAAEVGFGGPPPVEEPLPAADDFTDVQDDPYGPTSLAELDTSEPAMEAVQPEFEPQPDPAVQAAPVPEQESWIEDLPEYSVEEVDEDLPMEPSYVQAAGPQGLDEPSPPSVRSIEPVSAIDLVMEDSRDERPPAD